MPYYPIVSKRCRGTTVPVRAAAAYTGEFRLCLVALLSSTPFALRQSYVEFYNSERPHQGLHNQLVLASVPEKAKDSDVKVKSRLGGLLNYYYR